jgi:hypothetical protein
MTAQILYFPSNGLAYKPNPQDHSISYAQAEIIRERAQWASRLFDNNKELITKHIYNKLRVIFCVQHIEDIPYQYFEEALNLIEQADNEICDFAFFIRDLEQKFAVNVLRNGDPWTSNTKGKWRKKLAQQFPERPDWRALAKEIENYKELK